MNNKIYCLIGLSGSGKSTMAANIASYQDMVAGGTDSTPCAIINRDSLREMLFGYTATTIKHYYEKADFNKCESLVSKLQDRLIKEALAAGRDVISDNTNLKMEYINKLKKYGVPIVFILVDTDYFDCVSRDALRERSVGIDIINNQFKQLTQLKNVFDFKQWEPTPIAPIVQNEKLVRAYVFDIDGTLAINTGRSPYDYSKVITDSLKRPVAEVLHALSRDGAAEIIICSGREDSCRSETCTWLSQFGLQHKELHMRKAGDHRPDTVVKEEMYRALSTRYNIIGMFDDRQRVVEHARKLGFTVFDVANHTF